MRQTGHGKRSLKGRTGNRRKWLSWLIGSLFLIGFYLQAEAAGFKFYRNYPFQEYEHQPQNWAITQAESGLIYVANNGGVLEYDGSNWRTIKAPGYDPVRSLVIDQNGTIFIGGQNQLGTLQPDEKGSLQFQSLVHLIPDDQKDFSFVWETFTIDKYIYFYTKQFLFRYDPVKEEMITTRHNYKSFLSDGRRLLARSNTSGLEEVKLIENNHLETTRLPGSEPFANLTTYMIIPFAQQNILIATSENGLYLNNGEQTVPFVTDVDELLKKYKFSCGCRLKSGDIALGTIEGGLLIINSQGQLLYSFDKTLGLLNNNIKDIYEDREGNLWLCLNNGITKIEYHSPFSFFDERANLPGMVFSVVRHQGKLYAGTENGLFVLESSKLFRPIPGISSNCWSLVSTNDDLLAASSNGVFEVKEDKCIPITSDRSQVLLASQRFPNHLWCGTSNGLKILKKENNHWQEELQLPHLDQGIINIQEEKNSNLWLVTSADKVLKINFPGDNFSTPVITGFTSAQGLPPGRVHIGFAADHMIFATENGLFQFDHNQQQFIPDPVAGDDFKGGDSGKSVFRIYPDLANNIWLHSDSSNFQALYQKGGGYRIYHEPFRRLSTIQVNFIYPDPNQKETWFARLDGLYCYNSSSLKDYENKYQTLIRQVLVNKNELYNDQKINLENFKQSIPNLEYENRNLQFNVAATFFTNESATQYSYWMEGYDKDWSPWTKNNEVNYTNLDAGDYTFHVRAKNTYDYNGQEDIYQFRILSPWYQTPLAYILYGAGLFLLGFLSIKLRSVKLERDKKKLEKIIEERTKEIREKNIQLELQTDQLQDQSEKLRDQSEKLKEMDKVKSRFFANISHEFRTPLTLIMSPLEEMIGEKLYKKDKMKLTLMLQNSQHLLALVNQLLDLARFESGKMKLQASYRNIISFIKGIMACFDVLAQKNYLHLELKTNEPDIWIYFDAQKIEELMNNLIMNAIKFTPPGGHITISISREQPTHPHDEKNNPGFVLISVRDTGQGIAKEKLPNIFDRFYQADIPAGKNQKGTGLGLALTREIVKLHHGKIDVRSQEGIETEFTVRLPLGQAHLSISEITPLPANEYSFKTQEKENQTWEQIEIEEPDRDEEVENKKSLPGYQGNENNLTKDETGEKHIILVVEDHDAMRNHIREALLPYYTVIEAGDGKDGLAKAKEIIPDLIVSDIMMPGLDGKELCRVLKKEVKTSHIPIILLTARASEDDIIQGLEIGADDYITKPFNTQMLLSRIKNLVELRRQLQLKIQREKMLLPAEISVSSTDDQFLKDFYGIIYQNLGDPDFTIDSIYKKMDMSRATLFRKIQALTGETPNQFILSLRLERGAQLLKNNYGSVTDVAMAVGFSTSAYFSKCFKDRFKQSPSSFQASEYQSS